MNTNNSKISKSISKMEKHLKQRQLIEGEHLISDTFCSGAIAECPKCQHVEAYAIDINDNFLKKGVSGLICSFAFPDPFNTEFSTVDELFMQSKRNLAIRIAMQARLERKARQNINSIFPIKLEY